MNLFLNPRSIFAVDQNSGSFNNPKKLFFKVVSAFLVFIFLLYFCFNYLILTPPANFPIDTPISIPAGSSAKEITKLMSDSGFVNSQMALYLSLLLWHEPGDIKASTYIFSEPLSAKDLANELTTGHFANDLIKLTLIEGERAELIAKRAAEQLPNFKSEDFLAMATGEEGKLFPDTYLVPDSYTAKDLFTLLTKTYKEKIASIDSEIRTSSLSEMDIVKLASIVEREANTEESMRIVSGILQKRLDMGMPLQVDATLEYVLDKPLVELTADDLALDSPYNTYKNVGLPPTPIGNPGLDTIKAVLNPESTDYLFYITGNDGRFHYAKTFAEHKQNIAKYLR